MGRVGRLRTKGVGKCSGWEGWRGPAQMKFQKRGSLVGAAQLELYNAHICTYVDICIYPSLFLSLFVFIIFYTYMYIFVHVAGSGTRGAGKGCVLQRKGKRKSNCSSSARITFCFPNAGSLTAD